MSEDAPTCDNCRFNPARGQRPLRAGRCQRFPPTAAIGAPTIWPTVQPIDWCGEHPQFHVQRRETPAPAFVSLERCPACGVSFGLHKRTCTALAQVTTPAKKPRRRKAA